jgi:hypothetical protein
MIREWAGPAGGIARTWHGDRVACRAAGLPIDDAPACGEECAEGHAYAGRCTQTCTHRCTCGHDQQDHATSGYCNACEDHCDDNDGHYPDDCDARTMPDNPAASNNETTVGDAQQMLARMRTAVRATLDGLEADAERYRESGSDALLNTAAGYSGAIARIEAALDGPADTTPPAPGHATVTIRIHAPTDENAGQWATTIRDLVTAEHGQDMRLDIRITPPPADTCRPVQVGGETIRVHGSRPLTGLELGYAAEIVAAARRKHAANPPVVPDDDGTESERTRRIRARQRGLILPAVEPPDDSEPPVPCPACTRARSRGFTLDALAHPGCADALAGREASR